MSTRSMIDKEMKMTLSQALALIATADFKPFTQNDWYAFSGCESADPKIAYDEVAKMAIIMDGEVIEFIDDDDESIATLTLTVN